MGDLRYQSSLNSLPVTRLSSPDGNTSGTVNSCGASNFNGSPRSVGGSSATVAWLARVSRPRPKCAPVVTASNQETDSAYFSSSSRWRAMSSSRLSICSVSTLKYAVSTWCSRNVARTTTPVRPMPATVAQNRSSSGVSSWTPPSAVTSVSRRTWLPKLPTTWWALPWMSAPIAPPTVT